MVKKDDVCSGEVHDVNIGLYCCALANMGGVAVFEGEAGQRRDLDRQTLVLWVDWWRSVSLQVGSGNAVTSDLQP